MSSEKVILVDENDNQVGLMPKLEAHQKGLLHRAFSVFIFNSNYKLLLQKRAISKYHSGGLWTNTCCSHPRDGENTMDAANRRLFEEMGIKTNLRKVYDFIYKAELDNELTENEFDHLRRYLETGGSILVLLGEGGEKRQFVRFIYLDSYQPSLQNGTKLPF